MSPLCFHRLIMFESLWSLTILFASYCPYVSLKLCLKALLPIKSPWSRAGTWYPQHQDRHWLLSKQCCLSPGIHPSTTKKSQLTPETTESHIFHNTLLINTVWLHPSPQWITSDWSFTDHSSDLPVFPILWKDLHKCQHYLRMAQFSFIVYFWYLIDQHNSKPGRERQDMQALKSN